MNKLAFEATDSLVLPTLVLACLPAVHGSYKALVSLPSAFYWNEESCFNGAILAALKERRPELLYVSFWAESCERIV